MSFIPEFVGAALSYAGARNANKMNRRMAQEQMGFQERMSNTAYQRAVQDMRAAGINPMVAFSQGGASSPSGALSTNQNEFSQGVTSAVELRRARAELKNLEAQNDLIRSQILVNQATAFGSPLKVGYQVGKYFKENFNKFTQPTKKSVSDTWNFLKRKR